jgi:methylmalonyl-CoA mutase, N-terminal domain
LNLPTEKAARIALRTQQIIGYESGVVNTVDPLGGSYYVESLTDTMVQNAKALMNEIDQMGGAVSAVEKGWMQEEIARSSYEFQKSMELKEQIIVGVNQFQTEETGDAPSFKIDDSIRQQQSEKIQQIKNQRDANEVKNNLEKLSSACKNGENVMPKILESVESYATLGEIADTMRNVFGEYQIH